MDLQYSDNTGVAGKAFSTLPTLTLSGTNLLILQFSMTKLLWRQQRPKSEEKYMSVGKEKLSGRSSSPLSGVSLCLAGT